MRLVIDLQGAQTESSFRGIGRYSLALALGLSRHRGDHEVIIALNGMFPESIERIRATFDGVLSQDDIRVWDAPGPVRANDSSNGVRRSVAERMREAFFADQRPDVVLMTSLFEGFGDDAVTSIGVWDPTIPTATVLYDLIPLLTPDDQFRSNAIQREWYARKIESLRRSRLLVAISESSRQEAVRALGTSVGDVVNIMGACDRRFRPLHLTPAARERVRQKAGLHKPFVMYTGGADDRKNLFRLVEAFAALPERLRSKHQLAFVGRMPEGHVSALKSAAEAVGLTDELVFTGYVTDDDLVRLYNSCELLFFPSLHEGLGLPPLEAMACGAPVIAARATSLPEVVGLEEALFDPWSVVSMAAALERALDDDAFRDRLVRHGQEQHRKFNWDTTAERCWQALARFQPPGVSPSSSGLDLRRTGLFGVEAKKRILVQKLDHRGDLLLALPAISKLRARYPLARLEALVGRWNESMAQSTGLFDEVHFLDFFRSSSSEPPAVLQADIVRTARNLGRFDIAIDLRRPADTRIVLANIDAGLRVGYETLDSSVDDRIAIRLRTYPDVPYEATPLNRTHIAQQMLRLVDALPSALTDFVNLPSLGNVSPLRGGTNVALFPAAGNEIKQWPGARFCELALALAALDEINVVNIYFGSEQEASAFQPTTQKMRCHIGLDLQALVDSLSANVVCVANNSFGAHLAGYVGCTVVGVYGGHETVDEWGPAFGNSFALHANVFCSPCHAGSRAQCPYDLACLSAISVAAVMDAVLAACAGDIEESGARTSGIPERHRPSTDIVARVSQDIAELAGHTLTEQQLARTAACISANHRLQPRPLQRQLLVDVSELVRHDAGSGIQRVVRSVLRELLQAAPAGFSVEPVYASDDVQGFRYARRFKQQAMHLYAAPLEDEAVECWSGDIFLGLDLILTMGAPQRARLHEWRLRGTQVVFVVYDLLPILMPSAFDRELSRAYYQWLDASAGYDGLLCISRTVAQELKEWLDLYGPKRRRPLPIGWFHLGSDVLQSAAAVPALPASPTAPVASSLRPLTFLMVGTVEPRKGHADVLAAFEVLWSRGIEAHLVIVGKAGWMVDELAGQLRSHRELGQRLTWLQGISDEHLESIYSTSTALIAASWGEGFGLPLVEAARHGLALIARDIPVFREVAVEAAFYFPFSSSPDMLADCLVRWLTLHQSGQHPLPDQLRRTSWPQSATQLLRCVVGGHWQQRWVDDGALRFGAAHPRLHTTLIGERDGRHIRSNGSAGTLVYGPYVPMLPGHYAIRLWGDSLGGAGRAWFDVVHDRGRQELLKLEVDVSRVGRWNADSALLLETIVAEIEVRLWVEEGTQVTFEGMRIAPIEEDELPLPMNVLRVQKAALPIAVVADLSSAGR